MARKLQVDWQEDVEALQRRYKQESDHQNRTRLQALWLVRSGRTMQETAQVVGVHHRTVQEWIAWYRQGGLAAVLARRHGGHGGPARRLKPAQEAALAAKGAAGEVRTIGDGVAWAQAQGVKYTYGGMRGVFARLDLRLKVPRPVSPKASAVAQEAWKKGDSVRS